MKGWPLVYDDGIYSCITTVYCWICWKFFLVIYNEVYYWYSVFTWTVISGSLSPQHGMSLGCVWRNGLQYRGYLRIYWISSHGHPTRGGPPAWGMDEVLTTPHCKNISCWNIHTGSLRPGLILWYDLSNEKETWDLVCGMLGACIRQVHFQQQPRN